MISEGQMTRGSKSSSLSHSTCSLDQEDKEEKEDESVATEPSSELISVDHEHASRVSTVSESGDAALVEAREKSTPEKVR